jgi:hypothetical protein
MAQGSGRIVAGLDVHKRSTRIAAVQVMANPKHSLRYR